MAIIRRQRETQGAKEARLAKEARIHYLTHAPKALTHSYTWSYDPRIDDWVPHGYLVPKTIEGMTLRRHQPGLYDFIVLSQELRIKLDRYMYTFHKEKHGYIIEHMYQLTKPGDIPFTDE